MIEVTDIALKKLAEQTERHKQSVRLELIVDGCG